MFLDTKNIVAVATSPSAEAALNVVRCSGPKIFDIYKKITKQKSCPKANSAFLRPLYNQNNELIDRAVVLSFVAPKSFTGENMVEFSVHGGQIILKNLIDCLLYYGCRLAGPGEFTYRAFLNGKVDLIQAESINSLIRAQSSKEASLALNNMSGRLSSFLNGVSDSLTSLVVTMEHELDFNDSEISFIKQEDYIKQIKTLIKKIKTVLSSSMVAAESLSHIGVCFAGKTNVGKSSLFNFLIGANRAIVSSQAGTTRDAVSENVKINSTNIRLVDTAGIRDSSNNIEQKGIVKTRGEIKNSAVLLFIDDINPKLEFSKLKINHSNVILVLSKQDKAKKQNLRGVIKTSCVSGFGSDSLLGELKKRLDEALQKHNSLGLFLLNIRQNKELNLFVKDLSSAVLAFKKTQDLVVVLSFLYRARDGIQSTVKPLEKNEILNSVFGGFCVGK